MSQVLTTHGSVRQTLIRPFRFAIALSVTALLMSLGFLAYTAWSADQRIKPIERHTTRLSELQEASFAIQELLIHHVIEKSSPKPTEVGAISDRLRTILEKGGHLHPETPSRIQETLKFLLSDNTNREAGLLAALTLTRRVLVEESKLQREAIRITRESAEREFLAAAAALAFAPISAFLALSYIRGHSFRALSQLSEMLDNVGNLNFSAKEQGEVDGPFADLFARYNKMTESLQQAIAAGDRREEDLQQEVHTALETLLRQQAELADGAQLAALGEFSARVAHELRNPISGINFALRNLQDEVDDPDKKNRLALIGDEMERVARLLNSLLEATPFEPEAPRKLNMQALVGDILRLFRYQLPQAIDLRVNVENQLCALPRDTLRQILLNVLKNSVDAIGQGPGVIDIDMTRHGSLCKLVVADSGPGYPDDLLERGIRPFRTAKPNGAGLGLSIIQRLAQSAGGEIRLDRSAQGGARTIVTLPCGE
jgi:C4-dicarboxylate-specific signal transduction histidine kinase